MHKLDPKEVVKLGIITFAMLIFIGILMVWKSGIFLRASGYKLIGEFQNVGGLLDGADVRYRGYSVGKVAKVIPDPEKISATFWVYSNVKIPTNSKLRVIFDGLIGERFISIAPSEETQFVRPGDTLYGYATSGLADFVDVGTQSLEQSRQILESINSIVSSEEMLGAMKNSVVEFERLIRGLSEVTQEIRKVSTSKEINKLLKTMDTLADSLATISDEKVMDKVASSISNIEEITQELKEMLKDQEVAKNVKTTIKRSSDFVTTIANLEVSYDAILKYNLDNEDMSYDLSTDITSGSRFMRFGVAGANEWPDLFHIQIGNWLTNNFSTRIGFFYNSPGIGADYYLTRNLVFYTNLYDLKEVQWDFYGRYIIFAGLGLNLGVNNLLRDTRTYSVGISFSPIR